MAKQIEFFKLHGTIGDITFYKSQDGLIARKKGGISAQRIKTGSSFERTRENIAEFSKAARGGKVVREAFLYMVDKAKDNKLVSRLTKEMLMVVKSDNISVRGQRNLVNGQVQLLRGFNFNNRAHLSTTLKIPFIESIDRATGTFLISLPSYTPNESISAPTGTTHYKIVCAGAEMDFINNRYVVNSNESALLPYNSNPVLPLDLGMNVSANSINHLFLVLGIQFYQMVNGISYSLSNGEFNTLSIVSVEKA